jgi:hypothetical protein
MYGWLAFQLVRLGIWGIGMDTSLFFCSVGLHDGVGGSLFLGLGW